jgi:hypothetical protein
LTLSWKQGRILADEQIPPTCSATIHGYVEAINILFQFCHFNISADFSDCATMCSKIILAREREENIARQ